MPFKWQNIGNRKYFYFVQYFSICLQSIITVISVATSLGAPSTQLNTQNNNEIPQDLPNNNSKTFSVVLYIS